MLFGARAGRVGTGDVVLPLPSVEAGWLLLAFVAVDQDVFTSTMVAVDAGWAPVDVGFPIWSKIADGSETDVTFTCGGSGDAGRVFHGSTIAVPADAVSFVGPGHNDVADRPDPHMAIGNDYYNTTPSGGIHIGWWSSRLGTFLGTIADVVPSGHATMEALAPELIAFFTPADYRDPPLDYIHIDFDTQDDVVNDEYWEVSVWVVFTPFTSFESDVTHCVQVLDFPTANVGTISGRPPLLCATYGVMIIDRRNRATVLRAPLVGWDLTYGYRLDRPSDATITFDISPNGVTEECCERLGWVGEWMHDLVVFREGNREEVWGGPITSRYERPGQGKLDITAHSRDIWWGERGLPYDLDYKTHPTDAGRVFMDLARAAEQPRSHLGVTNVGGQVLPYDPVGLEMHGYETGVLVDQKVLLRADDVIIGDEMRSLADSVIDYTVIGRRCYVGALVVNLDPIPIIAQSHWVEHDPEIEVQGLGVATKVVVRGAGAVRAEYPPGQIVDPRWPQYGSHFKVIRDDTITDLAVAQERARSEWERWQQPNFHVVSTSGTLGSSSPVTVEDLIPGKSVKVALTESCLMTSLRLGEQRSGGRIQYFAFDTGMVQPLLVPQRLVETTVVVSDSVEAEVKIDTQALGTDVRTRGRVNFGTGIS